MKTYFDEFTKLSLNKMAQKITDMTYCYQETRVPITHYKKLLGKSAEEMVESSVAINLIDTYVKTLKTLHDENPKWFMHALLCIDMKITPANIKANEYQALELTHAKFLEDKAKHISKEYLEMYEDIRDNGATYRVE